MAFVMWKGPKNTQFLLVRSDYRGVRYANLWTNADPERQRINNQVFYTYYQQLCTLIASRPIIIKEVPDMYKKGIRFMADMHRIYIKPRGVKEKDWYTGAYWMERQDVEEIIKEWSEEWRNSIVDISDSDEEKEKEEEKEKGKGKEKIGEKKKKEHTREKRKASQEESKPHKRQKMKAHKPPTDAQLGSADYEGIASYV
jgi:hypothetical protein